MDIYRLYFKSSTQWILWGGFLILLSILTYAFDLDRQISSYFFRSVNSWQGDNLFVDIIYKLGYLPGLTLLAYSIRALLLIKAGKHSVLNRAEAWMGIAGCLLGPGLLVNGILKPFFTRPRPVDTNLFGGDYEFAPLFHFGDFGLSFSSGHVAFIAYLGIVLFMFRRTYPRASKITFEIVTFVITPLMMYARISVGGHYFSDAFWSIGLINLLNYYIYIFCMKYIHEGESQINHISIFNRISGIAAKVIIPLFLFIYLQSFLTAKWTTHYIDIPQNIKLVELELIPGGEPRFDMNTGNTLRIDHMLSCRTLPWVSFEFKADHSITPEGMLKVKTGNIKSFYAFDCTNWFKINMPKGVEYRIEGGESGLTESLKAQYPDTDFK